MDEKSRSVRRREAVMKGEPMPTFEGVTWKDGQPITARMQGTIDDYRAAMSHEGPLAYEWQDKPHRLVYDLCGEVAYLTAALTAARQAVVTVQHAARTIIGGADRRVLAATAHEPAARVAIATLDSERAANARLTEENDALRAVAERAVHALADIGFAEDLTDARRVAKARRVYREVSPQLALPGERQDGPGR